MIVNDRDGKFLLKVEGANFLDERDLRRADFSGQDLEGINLSDSDLREADIAGADLYWASAFRANFGSAILRRAKLAGANLVEANFRGADLREAYLSFDNLGGPARVNGADFTKALLDGANLTGCEYDDKTVFPEGFDPASYGMIWVDSNHVYIRPGSFASASLEPGDYIPDEGHRGVYIPEKKQ